MLDLIVIGGGPAGMMAAGRAAQLGAKVLLLEKNNQLGLKLLSTGHERCNLTNNVSVKELVAAFAERGKFLFSAFSKFNSVDLISFFEDLGVAIKTENNHRSFPVSNKAMDVRDALLKFLAANQVEIKYNAAVKKIIKVNNLITKIILINNQELEAKNYLITTGGLSYPQTGSTGDAYAWLESLGHTVVKPVPALSPIFLKNKFIKNLEGLSLENVKLNFLKNNKIFACKEGDVIFTAKGLSGPAVLALSGAVARALPEVDLSLDLCPEKTLENLDQSLLKIFADNKNKQIKNILNSIMPARLSLELLKILNIDTEISVNNFTKANRLSLINIIKDFKLKVSEVEGFNKAMLTSGGVALSEINPSKMRSKLINNLYLAGEVLDLDGPTGGFNLQMCWSTGHLLGESIV